MSINVLHVPILVIGRIFMMLLGQFPRVYVAVLMIIAVTVSLLVSELIIKKVRIFQFALFGEN